MSSSSPIRKSGPEPGCTDFYHYPADNFFRIEHGQDGVLIRTMRDDFSDRGKANFIRQLALEGFIPDQYQWFSESHVAGSRKVVWVADASWISWQLKVARLISRYTRPVLATSFVVLLMAVLAWLGLRGYRLESAGATGVKTSLPATHYWRARP